ncbi:MAG TPA: metallophosphoesterase [Gemmatimonadaceae bacterium]
MLFGRQLGSVVVFFAAGFGVALDRHSALAQGPDTNVVIPITPPRTPIPPEDATRNVTKFSFIAYGDTRGAFDGTVVQYEHSLVVATMLRTIRARAATADPIKFVVQSGDAVVDGRSANQLNVSYVPVINQLTAADIPYFLAVGNHDVRTSTSLTDSDRVKGLKNYFSANSKLIPPEGSPRRLSGYPTYAFGYGNTFVLLFDSIIANDTTQLNWIRRQLEGLDRRRYVNVVVVCHHPAFSSGPHGGSNVELQTTAMRTLYMPLFRKHHVALLLTGHEHLFEHWVERYSDATGPHRIDEIVSGGGGAPLYGYMGEPDLRQYISDNASSQVRLEHLVKPEVDPGANPHHFVVVHVDGPKITLEVVGVYWGSGFQPYRSATVQIVP